MKVLRAGIRIGEKGIKVLRCECYQKGGEVSRVGRVGLKVFGAGVRREGMKVLRGECNKKGGEVLSVECWESRGESIEGVR